MEQLVPNGAKWGQGDFSLLIQTLPTFWATWILILRILIFGIYWVPKFVLTQNTGSRLSAFQMSESSDWHVLSVEMAQVGGPKPGTSGCPSWAQARNLAPNKIKKIKILKIKICVAQNVGKV